MISKVIEVDGMPIELQVRDCEGYDTLVLGYSWSRTISKSGNKFVSWCRCLHSCI